MAAKAFDQADFDKETSRTFDPAEIKQLTQKYVEKAKQQLGDKDQVLKVVSLIDLTTLSGDDTRSRVEALAARGLRPVPSHPDVHVGAICVYPQRVTDVKNYFSKVGSSAVHVASVAAGFPSGQYHIRSKVLEVELAVADGVTEIDIVISRASALEGDWKTVYDEVAALKKACGTVHLKTILATGELKTLENVYKASWASILGGSDFIKTSTGKESVNATLEAAYVMCQAAKRWFDLTGQRVGFKPAGGIRVTEEALSYIALVEDVLGPEWVNPKLLRIGASSLLDDCVSRLQ